ncbi:UNVERIFIED_CONTAM: hypothetical protein Scaly_3135700 [Sesamum calycinum]|uniref:Uncharacterized protein n=3 Tax=Sesamum TaxID=4181 RepID=A0AAE1T7I5_9LAMI|nr:hypothetical protein Sango_2754500 [Sesamum angolense]
MNSALSYSEYSTLSTVSSDATGDSIPSSTLVLPAQQPPAPHSSSTSGSIHPMVTRSRDGTRRPRAWFQSFSSALVALGFSCSRANPSMFIWRSSSEIVILLLYVDISF